jgi:adenylyltransferase/sulfurtransferase
MVPTCPEAGIFSPIVGIMGTMQAAEALKELSGLGDPNQTPFLMIDSLTLQSQRLLATRNPQCITCGDNRL